MDNYQDAERDLREQASQADEATNNNSSQEEANRPLRGAAKESHRRKVERDAFAECNGECGTCPALEACKADTRHRMFTYEAWAIRQGLCCKGIGRGLVYTGAGVLLVGVHAGRAALKWAKTTTKALINVFEFAYSKLNKKREGK